jgi:outer membrane protein assembly factor BamD (BamD/ComL family)
MSAFDWELWVRIATRYDAFYYPEPLVNVGRDDTAETSRLMRTGEQVTDAFRAIDVMVHHLPESTAQRLASKARDRIAEYAIEIAAQFLERGDLTAAIANMQAAASGHPSSRTNSRLAELLRGDFHVPGI